MAKTPHEIVDYVFESLSGTGLMISMVLLWMSPPADWKPRLLMLGIMLFYVLSDWWVSTEVKDATTWKYNAAHAVPMVALALLIENGAGYVPIMVALTIVFLVGAAGHAIGAWSLRRWMFAANVVGFIATPSSYLIRSGDFKPLIGIMAGAAFFSLLANFRPGTGAERQTATA
jgi:hypothetical protein